MMLAEAVRRVIPIRLPIFQAPMAGVSTPALAAAVSNAGGLGGLGLGASTIAGMRAAIVDTQGLTAQPFCANFFCHTPAPSDPALAAAWCQRTAPLFAEFGAVPPAALHEIYPSFRTDDAMLDLLLALRPAVVSFHFGLPKAHQIKALRDAGLVLMASATSLAEAQAIEAAGFDLVIAQGWEAGGHRGIFDPDGADAQLSTLDLTRMLAAQIRLPVVAAGGIMDGRDIAQALQAGAVAAQLGTAFIACPESSADAAYRARLAQGGQTVMTRAISGRPARCLANRFTAFGESMAPGDIPAYPTAYDLGKALNAAAKAQGETGFGAQWSGTGAGRTRSLGAAALMADLVAEISV